MSIDAVTEQKILQCIDEGLEILGDKGKRTVHSCLEKDIGLKREDIPEKPELFCEGLNLILGDHGAVVVTDCIVRKLLTRFSLKQKPDLTLSDVIQMIKTVQNGLR